MQNAERRPWFEDVGRGYWHARSVGVVNHALHCFRRFRDGNIAPMEPISCYAYINAKIMPVARGKRFEIPLDEMMIERGIGTVEGGGTLQAKDGEIIHCGIDIELNPPESNVNIICEFLARCGAPRGSKLQVERDGQGAEVPFGTIEGIGVYLNGTDLADEVYRTSDINVVMETFEQLTSDTCVMKGYWRGQKETALYLYGKSAGQLESQVAPFLAEYPLCQKARVVRIA